VSGAAAAAGAERELRRAAKADDGVEGDAGVSLVGCGACEGRG